MTSENKSKLSSDSIVCQAAKNDCCHRWWGAKQSVRESNFFFFQQPDRRGNVRFTFCFNIIISLLWEKSLHGRGLPSPCLLETFKYGHILLNCFLWSLPGLDAQVTFFRMKLHLYNCSEVGGRRLGWMGRVQDTGLWQLNVISWLPGINSISGKLSQQFNEC